MKCVVMHTYLHTNIVVHMHVPCCIYLTWYIYKGQELPIVGLSWPDINFLHLNLIVTSQQTISYTPRYCKFTIMKRR